MAERDKGTIMGHSSCDWVHDWLPLMVEDSDGLGCEGNDLNAEDRRRIEQHLAECSQCRQHQAALEEACSVLSVAAADFSADLRSPSLWPKLEERIQRHHDLSRSRWTRALHALCPDGVRAVADRFASSCHQLCGNLPLQLTWTRDSAAEFLEERVQPLFASVQARSSGSFRLLTPQLGLGLGLAGAGMVLLCLAMVMHQHRQTQEVAPIAAWSAPLSSASIDDMPFPDFPEASEDVVTSTSSSTVLRASKSPSLSTSAAPGTATSMRQTATAKTPSTITTTTAPATTASRYDFDLENGTPMPPETRTDKPAY